MNIILSADSYKYSMHKQYPQGTEKVFSYIESRGGDYDNAVFFGLQGFIKQYLLKPITQDDIDEAKDIIDAHMGEGIFNLEGWQYILDVHKGYLPLEIRAIPEGSVIPVSNLLMSVVNTDPKCYWLTTFMETALLRAIWYPTTVATRSYYIKETIKKYLNMSGSLEGIDFKHNSFGARGVSSSETSDIGGAAHLTSFKGTDNVSSLKWLRKYYDIDMAGYSVVASEHSIHTSFGRDNELDSYNNMLVQFPDSQIISCVSDSYNIYEACHMVGKNLSSKIKERIANGFTYAIRPDSGEPIEVILRCLNILKEYFDVSTNAKGYKVINGVRILWGDGIAEKTIENILESVTNNNWSADNLVFGQGGGLLQALDRDTMKFAMKCSATFRDGKWHDVYKDPITDQGKQSKRGLLDTYYSDGKYYTSAVGIAPITRIVFNNGHITNEENFETIRERVSYG